VVAAIRGNYPLDQEDGKGRNALSWAAAKGFAPEAGMMLERGAWLDKPDGQGKTPLILAAEGGHAEAVDVFVAAHARLDLRDKEGRTAAERALGKGFNQVTMCLVAAGAAPPPVDLDTELKQPAAVFARPLALRKPPGA
jgi:cytohesin